MPNSADERAFLEQLRAGNDAAAEALVRDNIGWMRVLATRILGDPSRADDCVQEAFLSAFKGLDGFNGRSRLKTWLHSITTNSALMKLRKLQRLQEQDIDSLQGEFDSIYGIRIDPVIPAQATPLEQLEEQGLREQVLSAIAQLPESYRIVLQMRDIQEMSTREVADALEIGEDNVKVRLHRARAALKTLLQTWLSAEDLK